MKTASITKKLKILPATFDDYRSLKQFHYRSSACGPAVNIFAIRHPKIHTPVGVITYSMPPMGLELRNFATGNIFNGLGRNVRQQLINSNIRIISRVIIDPRFRGLSLASWLVEQTMPLVEFPIIESLAVMGHVNSFFEKAGMTAYHPKKNARTEILKEALSLVGIQSRDLIDARLVRRKIEKLKPDARRFIDLQISSFLTAYGNKLSERPLIDQVTFVLSRLGERPVYFLWFNPKLKPYIGA